MVRAIGTTLAIGDASARWIRMSGYGLIATTRGVTQTYIICAR